MKDNKINVRLRLVIIKNDKLLLQYRQKGDFYHYVGGHLEYGETILEGCLREIAEECDGAKFEFKKILYISDFIKPEINGHSVELFILGDIDKFEELEHLPDPQHPEGDVWCTWVDINNLPKNLLPHQLSQKVLDDHNSGFKESCIYVGNLV